MKVAFGEKALEKSWQAPFSDETECVHCRLAGLQEAQAGTPMPPKKAMAQFAFVAYEGLDEGVVREKDQDFNGDSLICNQRQTTEKAGGLWLHDCCAVAVYFCPHCLKATALYNQG